MKTLEQVLKSKPIYLNDWKDSKRFGVISDFENLSMDEAEFKAKEAPYSNVEYWKEKVINAKKALKEWKEKNIKILFASYSYENYSGDAFVLFEQNGELFETNGSHCSCYGLEGQLEAESVVLKELENRLIKGTFGTDSYCGNDFNSELKKFLGIDS
jgi:hypothetical protein